MGKPKETPTTITAYENQLVRVTFDIKRSELDNLDDHAKLQGRTRASQVVFTLRNEGLLSRVPTPGAV
jgi:hypothetical protein